jgi:hypothetical protein
MLGSIDQSVQGISAGFDRLEHAARNIARDGASGDLNGNLVELMRAGHDVEANVAALRAANEMIGTLLDVMA